MKRACLMLLAAIMILGLLPAYALAEGEAAPDPAYAVTLTKIGTVDADRFTTGSVFFDASGVYVRTGDKYQLLDWQGNDALGETYDYATYLAGDAWLVQQADKGVNCCGLVRTDGTVLIPVSAAIIKTVGYGIDARYLEVTYATEEVTNQDDAYLFASQSSFTLVPQDGDKLYAGYSLYYDLKNEGFVGELKRTDTSGYVEEVGDKLFFDRQHTVYDPNGAVFATFSGYARDNYFVGDQGDDGLYPVYDCDLRQIAALEINPDKVYFDGQLFGAYGDGAAVLQDANGATVGEAAFRYPPDEYGAFLCGYDAEDRHLVMDRTGKIVLSADDGVTYIDEKPYEFLRLDFADGTVGLLYPDGSVVKGGNIWDLLLFEEREVGSAMMILNDRAYMELPEGFDSVNSSPFLFSVEREDGTSLYDVFTGRELLRTDDTSYHAFHAAGDYVYMLVGDTYEIYRVEVVA